MAAAKKSQKHAVICKCGESVADAVLKAAGSEEYGEIKKLEHDYITKCGQENVCAKCGKKEKVRVLDCKDMLCSNCITGYDSHGISISGID